MKGYNIFKGMLFLSLFSFVFLLTSTPCQFGAGRVSESENIMYFKPQGIPLKDLQEVVLEPAEFEAIKLHDFDNRNIADAAVQLNVSESVFVEILNSAYKKIAQVLVLDKALQVNKVNV